MHFSTLDGSRAVPCQELRPSSQAGCVNVILPDGRVLSAHGDDRDPGSDGPWEQGQVAGQLVTYLADGKFFTWIIVPADKLPR